MGSQSFLHNLCILSSNVVVMIWVSKSSQTHLYAYACALLTMNLFVIVPIFAINSTMEILVASALGAK